MDTMLRRGTAHARAVQASARPAVPEIERPRGRRADRIRDGLIGVLAVIGTLTVAWIAVSWLLGLSVIVFVTGSMAPSMPTGAAAVVHQVPAAELIVGDVVTVTRPGSTTPVTHRIIDIAEVPHEPDARSLTLQGDANQVADTARYVVTKADRVIASAPSVGRVVIWLKDPVVMVCLSFFVAGAIVWAFWPSVRRDGRDRRSEE